jgi:acyl-coenzyme A thioesterase PaaI-like protein
VTAEFSVKLLRPTPSTSPLKVIAKATHRNQNRVTVEAQIESEGKIRATCTGLFVSVGPGHPGYHRW